MRSPVHPSSVLVQDTVDPGVRVMRCPKTNGVWLRHRDYLNWQKGQAPPQAAVTHTDEGEDVPAADSPAGKRCPEDGYFLIRHRVGHGLDFHLDRCGHCAGVWLDVGEWQALRQHGLHKNLGLIFTSAWQAENRRQQQMKLAEKRMLEWFGEKDFTELQRVRQWIDEHDRAYEIRAFLNGEYD